MLYWYEIKQQTEYIPPGKINRKILTELILLISIKQHLHIHCQIILTPSERSSCSWTDYDFAEEG